MIVDLVVGGVLIPGLLALVFVAMFATLATIHVLRVVGLYRLFARWPLVELATFVLIYGLLVQHLPSIGR